MISLKVIYDRLKSKTSYTIEYAKDKEPNIQELTALPIVTVGYAGLDSKSPNLPIEHDIYNLHGENLVQSFDIISICDSTKPDTLAAMVRNIHGALVGYTPTVSIASLQGVSGLTYSQGGVIGLVNSKIIWLDRYKIGFPTIDVLF